MDATSSSAAFMELQHFCEVHNRATRLLNVAAQDYAASRCLLLNGLFTGFVLGAQAIEKFLKAYLLFNKPQYDEKQLKKLNHSLSEPLKEAANLFPQLQLSRFEPLATQFTGHFAARYPDNPGALASATTADLAKLDEFIIFLNENMPCPRNVKYRTGLYALFTFSLGYHATVTPWEFWIKNNNQALAPLLPCIGENYAAVMNDLHPQA